MKALHVLVTVAVLALANPPIAGADDTSALISGRFVKSDGSGIAGAIITIGSAGQFQATQTDRDGYFIIFDARPGEYTVFGYSKLDLITCLSPIIDVHANIPWRLRLYGGDSCHPMPLREHIYQMPW